MQVLTSLSIKTIKGAGLPALPELRAVTEMQNPWVEKSPRLSSLWVIVLYQTFPNTGHCFWSPTSPEDLKLMAVDFAMGVSVKAIWLSVLPPKPRTHTVSSPTPRAQPSMLGNASGHLLKSRKARSGCKDPELLNQPTTRAPAQTQASRCFSSFHFLSELLSNICVSFSIPCYDPKAFVKYVSLYQGRVLVHKYRDSVEVYTERTAEQMSRRQHLLFMAPPGSISQLPHTHTSGESLPQLFLFPVFPLSAVRQPGEKDIC